MIPPCYLLVQNADHGSELTLSSWGRLTLEGRAKHVGGGGNLDFLNLVMMGIKRPLAMKAMHSCSTDRTIA